MAITRQQIELEGCYQSPKTQQILQFKIKKKTFTIWMSRFLFMFIRRKYFLCKFRFHLDDVIILWEPSKRTDCV